MKSYTRIDTAYGVIELTLSDERDVLVLSASHTPVGTNPDNHAELTPDQVDALIHILQGTRALMR